MSANLGNEIIKIACLRGEQMGQCVLFSSQSVNPELCGIALEKLGEIILILALHSFSHAGQRDCFPHGFGTIINLRHGKFNSYFTGSSRLKDRIYLSDRKSVLILLSDCN